MDKMKPIFEALNQELSQANLHLSIICVGGYVLEYQSNSTGLARRVFQRKSG